ncbi:MAG: serine acetyltransferase [Candidatus Riflebacteria bacterium]|nr:serine acetyltransferase [Candidatus Riflebacteria bacterium]
MSKKRLNDVAHKVAKSISKETSKIQHFDHSPLPDKKVVADIIEDIFAVLYPGYFGSRDICFDSVEIRISYTVALVFDKLAKQIRNELIHSCCGANKECTHCDDTSEEIALQFLEGIPALREELDYDVEAAYKHDPAATSFDEIIFSYPGLQAITVHRVAHFFYSSGLRLIPRIMSEWAHSQTGIDIHPGAKIGKAFFIDHGTGVVIGETTIIGDYVAMYQGVTLGALNFPHDQSGRIIKGQRRHPRIEDSVVIYAGATILGGETVIGEHSVIGGNVWLVESVPAYSKVILTDSGLKILERKGPKKVKKVKDDN